MPVYDYDCGSINERIQSCDNLKTQSSCEPNTGLYWTSDSDGNAKLCEWNDLINKCVATENCNCPVAPFVLDKIGENAPTKCEDLDGTQCHYFRTSDDRRCVLTLNGTCVTPTEKEPVCKHFADDQYNFSAWDDSCPIGTKKSCADICKTRGSGQGDPRYTGPSTEILSYPCYGFWSYGNGKYCKCSFR